MRKIFSALALGLAAPAAVFAGSAIAQASPATTEAATWGHLPGVQRVGDKPALDYHWCPGEFWNPLWGFNWEGGECHDDHHRDADGDDHSRDFGDDHRDDRDHHDDGDHRDDRDHHDDNWPNRR